MDGDGHPIDESSAFLWGSVSKPVAATLVSSLLRDGVLDLDDRVSDLVPTFTVGGGEQSSRITVRHLLDHTSGLPPALQVTDQDDPRRRPIDGLRELSDLDLLSEPGSEHHYSSANYLVLAAVVEAVTGSTYADQLSRTILDPLDMTDVVTTSEDADRHLPPGHRYVAGRSVAFESPYDPAGLAYGYLGGTITDLARFAQAQLGGAPDVVTPTELTAMHAPSVTTGSGGNYGLGWRQDTLKSFGVTSSTPIVWHSGAAPGYQSAIILLPEQQQAVVVLQNSYGYFQESALLDASIGVAAVLTGVEPATQPGTGVAYPGVLLGLGVTLVGLIFAAGRAVTRIARPRPLHTRRRTLLQLMGWLTLSAALAYLLGVLLPGMAGLKIDQLTLWVPDVGWLTISGVVLAITLAVLRTAVALRELTNSGNHPR